MNAKQLVWNLTGLALAGLLAVVLGLGALPGQAMAFPDKPIQLIVPWSAGGGSDRSMRLVADAATKKLGVPVIVINKPGAGGAVGTQAIASAKPDGYTIGMVGSGVIARHYANPNANKFTDLEPLVFFGADPAALSARTDLGFKNVSDFLNYAKKNPGKIKNGNDSPGGASYIAIAVIEKSLGIKVIRVPYKGYSPTVAALLAGEVDTATVPVPDAIEHHKAGKIRILAVAGQSRHFIAPDVPTFKEQGYDLIIGSWRTIVAPKGVPRDRFRILEAKLMETLKDSEFVGRANTAGFAVSPMGSRETSGFWTSYDKSLYPVLLESGLVKVRKK